MLVFVALIAGITISGGFGRQLDSTKCRINDPQLSNCVLKALNSLTPEIETQSEKPSFDPFTIPMVRVSQESNTVNYTSTCQNYTMRGMNNFDVKEVSFDPESMTFRGRVEYSPLSMVCDYMVQGQLVFIPVSGEGIIHVALGPINARLEVKGEMKKSSTASYYNPTGIKIRMEVDDMGLNFDGLFGGNVELGRMTNEALNANSKMLVDALTPAMEKFGERVFLKSIRRISKRIMYDE